MVLSHPQNPPRGPSAKSATCQAFVETDALHKAALEAAAFAVRDLGCISRLHLSAASRLHLSAVSRQVNSDSVKALRDLGCISAISRLYLR